MTSAFHIEQVDAAVAALTIPGVTRKSLDSMTMGVDARECPLFGPSVGEPSFLTDWETRRLTLEGNQQNSYTLNYTLYQAPVGKDRGLFKLYPSMVDSAKTIVDALQALARVDGCKSIALRSMPQFGPVHDALGQVFIGATFAVRVVEF